MTVSDDFIVDFGEAFSMESVEMGIFAVDVCSEEYIPANTVTEFGDWSAAMGKMEEGLPPPKYSPDVGMLRHPRSGSIESTNSRQEFEWDLLSIDLEPDRESAGKPRARWLESGSARPSAFFTSALVHVAIFFLFAFFPVTQAAGTSGYAGNVFSATILFHEDLIPQDASPASVDSAASAPSVAKKSKKAREIQPLEPPQQPVDMHETAPKPTRIATLEKEKLPEKKDESKEQKKEVTNQKEDPRGDGLHNSLASMPSTASAERRFIPAAGQGGEAFDFMVLSAIREAIFFPKQAARERQHGEVIVSFSINKDRSILSLGITKSSGLTILDEAAIKIIQKAAKKFPPFPEGLSTDALHYEVPILFKQKGK